MFHRGHPLVLSKPGNYCGFRYVSYISLLKIGLLLKQGTAHFLKFIYLFFQPLLGNPEVVGAAFNAIKAGCSAVKQLLMQADFVIGKNSAALFAFIH